MQWIRLRGGCEHNLKNVSVDVPRDSLTVFTGVSGSGKSSLAYDTIFREGQRRFLESLPAYARRFLGAVEKPEIESLDGLSPTVSIDQKTVSRNPRSTVGTITEIHDYLRLLYARLGTPFCYRCGREVTGRSADEIVAAIGRRFAEERVLVCAPVVRARRGAHRGLLEELRRDGFLRVAIDGQLHHLRVTAPELNRNHEHTIAIVYDRLHVEISTRSRLTEAVEKSLELAAGFVSVAIQNEQDPDSVEPVATFSNRFACPDCDLSFLELEPRLFSFNSVHGMCEGCQGLGQVERLDPDLLIENPSLPFCRGGVEFIKKNGGFTHPELDWEGFVALGERHGFSPESSWGDLSEEARAAVLSGDSAYAGWLPTLSELLEAGNATWLRAAIRALPCTKCNGARLSAAAQAVRFADRTIVELSAMPAAELESWLHTVEPEDTCAEVAEPILRDLRSRLRYLREVGLGYLSMSRSAATLSGGEAQRLRLAGQVGANLQGILYVLDEPSVGLHPRDHGRLLRALQALRDQGNTVLVVEHDENTMRLADHLVDVGPGAGPEGGEIIVSGTLEDVMASDRSLTGQYLSGRKSIPLPQERRPQSNQSLDLYGVQQNNLKNIDVRIPLQRFVVVTGVSGSGKSSLVKHVLQPALEQILGRRNAMPGTFRALKGYRDLDKTVVIDQSPIGRSPRSNPATYVKAFDAIRNLFAKVPEAQARGYRPGRFSFNKDEGRCRECGGAGVRIVEMQFLAAVEVVCDICDGKRYNRETLQILYRGKSVFDVLQMNVAEGAAFFADHPKIARPLVHLEKIGLGYMSLGQPATTLSGGEAQRVKLAGELRKRDTGRTLYILDEPTTGLHFEDIGKLLKGLQELVDRGNSVIVIEHNLDVVKVADHVIDLGPEAGEEGGEIVAEGTPEEICVVDASHTGHALAEWLAADRADSGQESPLQSGDGMPVAGEVDGDLEITGARCHNLKSVDVTVPKHSLTVFTGVSGSGKTSLAIDTVFAEGQRRYLESLSTYARRFLGQFDAPPVDRVRGLAPAIAIDQHSTSNNPRSTVATITEIYDYLRILYARVGTAYCADCHVPLVWTTPSQLAQKTTRENLDEKFYVLARAAHPRPAREKRGSGTVSVAELEEWRAYLLKSGFTRVLVGEEELRLDEPGDLPIRKVLSYLGRPSQISETEVSDSGLYVVVDRVVTRESTQTRLASSLELAFGWGGGEAGLQKVGEESQWYCREPTCPQCGFRLEVELSPRVFSFNNHQGACERCSGLGEEERADEKRLLRHPDRPLPAALDEIFASFLLRLRPSVHKALTVLLHQRGLVETPVGQYASEDRAAILLGEGVDEVTLDLGGGAQVPVTWEGLFPALERWARLDTLGPAAQALQPLFCRGVCASCDGGRLRRELLAVRIDGKNIREFTSLTIAEALYVSTNIALSDVQTVIAEPVLTEIQGRLRFLVDVGLGYLTIDRTADSLSGGEAQRIRLASQLGNRLAGVIYVLDEPTIGLHQSDTEKLIESLKQLRDLGNTVAVVEHDREMIEAADRVIELGPGAGSDGGHLVAAGTPAEITSAAQCLTGSYLRGEKSATVQRARAEAEKWLELRGLQHHNLVDVDVAFPLGRLTAVTGVSGSGKSSLVLEGLASELRVLLSQGTLRGDLLREVNGYEDLQRLAVVDQRPLGRTPRSNAATYTKIWDHVRELFASLPLSKVRGYSPSRFSFNLADGRCATCEGQGAQVVDMEFLSDVWVTCPTCHGRRFNQETLKVLFKEKNIGEVLDLEVDHAIEFFKNQPAVVHVLEKLSAVGLGYLKLGQAANTLSGGEAQRVKLATELSSRVPRRTLYILDEPTTGLHFDDVRRLVEVLQALVDVGHSVVVIEHHVDVILSADWVIDLGPGAGEEGGRVIYSGPVDGLEKAPESVTGRCLRESARLK